MILRLLRAETRREFKHAQSYYFDVIADQVLFTLMFLLISGVIHLLLQGTYTDDAILVALIGFVTWRVADGCILGLTENISEDANVGVLEQIYLSAPLPEITLLTRGVVVFFYHSARGFLLALVVLVILRISLPNSPIVSLLLVFGITQIGALGVAYIISGLHLVYKKTASITLALSTALLFLTGAITPLNNAPVLYVLTRFLPLTIGIELLRKIVFTDMSVVTLFAQTEFYLLILNSVTYGAVGFFCLRWGQNIARERGSLAHY